jgi:TPR repeat protein
LGQNVLGRFESWTFDKKRNLWVLGQLISSPSSLASVEMPFKPDLGTGYSEYKKGDYKSALEHFLPLAERGDPLAQTMRGIMFELGEGGAANSFVAVGWYRKAAQEGFACAQARLGWCYHLGLGVKKEPALAYMWVFLTTSQGLKAAEDLGQLLTR